ncbi:MULTISPECIES: hypothetical protein [unclassified Bradyrhizobium]|uniref:hypothetical protein n=1 Tax=unclassified Bradyrhizobium TaxID=2631580 RepID=UPI0024790169|nr:MULTISPECIES: hypothetical protein [unclassified Bradyrhizobium]WGR73088.1 hypothetical protein MTX24_09770 [Bradyrhizobium sp. ISRA426]WGR77927.1 hypothetical protein MTX21_34740 [Bradyrhizobium sp. ISRA430]WGR88329.1 hypothetical protein MTX25_09780 [Bradyrhizobium sp. ISRA432]
MPEKILDPHKPKAMESRRRLSTSSGLPQMQDDPEQSRAFIEKAREIEADEERSAADELIKRFANTPNPKLAPK